MDLTVAAVPVYFGSMGAEHLALKRRAAVAGPSSGDYERRDTIASLAMGTASLLAPIVVPKLLGPITPGKGRYGKVLVATALGAAAAATVADILARTDGELPPAGVVPTELPATAPDAGDADARPGRDRRRR
ncbi:MAG: Alkylglycerol monooxygenase, partial [Acidimicrobiales bacterium]|nr:Alkylglycerol monooxygenase [Acidimicrobiales bacterium]